MLQRNRKQNILNWCYSLETKLQNGDHVRIDNFNGSDTSVFGIFCFMHDGLCLVDFKLQDSMPGRVVMNGIEPERCHKITKQEWFKFKLQGKGVGLYV